jgi:hypothetical protein
MGIPFGAYELLNKYMPRILGSGALGIQHAETVLTASERRCLMFGRAKMSLSPNQVAHVSVRDEIPDKVLAGWADAFLHHRGFDWVQSLDYADFEGASYLWNLNVPLDEARDKEIAGLCSTIDLILDYGTSEHVFNPSMSFYNGTKLLKCGGVLNTVLPIFGYCDHGMYQFTPSFFYAIDRPELNLEALYFFSHDKRADSLVIWDGLSDEFREHIHGAFDGSYAASCLRFLNEPILAWALFRKHDELDQSDFMQNTQQLIYKSQWAGSRTPEPTDNRAKLDAYESPGPERAERLAAYVRSISLRIDQIRLG